MPGGKFGGGRHQAIVQTVDLLPTILGVFGVRARGRPAVHGHDLLPLIRGEQTKVRDYACMGSSVLSQERMYCLPMAMARSSAISRRLRPTSMRAA